MFDLDPRFLMADVYKAYRRAGKSTDEFDKEIRECEGPDDAIQICYSYLSALEEQDA